MRVFVVVAFAVALVASPARGADVTFLNVLVARSASGPNELVLQTFGKRSVVAGSHFAVFDNRGYLGEVEIGARADVEPLGTDIGLYAATPTAPLCRALDIALHPIAVGPMEGAAVAKRGRVLLPKPPRKGVSKLFADKEKPAAAGVFVPWVAIDLDGDGLTDVERGVLLCDERRARDGHEVAIRSPHEETRVREHGVWRYASGDEYRVYEFDEDEPPPAAAPFHWCPNQPKAP